jgi:cysteine desulfurase
MRAGTLNTPAIVGLGAAIQFAIHELPMESKRLAKLRDQLLAELNRRIQGIRVNGSLGQRLPGNLNVSIQGVDSEALLFSLKRIAISSGSACTSLSVEPSHVLTALGLDREDALSSIRISIGRFNTEEDIEIAIEEISQQVDKIRSLRGWSKEAGITKMSIVNQSHAG